MDEHTSLVGEAIGVGAELIADRIADRVTALDREVHAIAASSQENFRRNLKPGESVPNFGEYEAADDDAARRIYEADIDAYHDVLDLVDIEVRHSQNAISEPASADAVSTVALALSRENIGAEELQALLDRYGSNYQLQAAILERAAKAHVFLSGKPMFTHKTDAETAAGHIINRHGYRNHSLSSGMMLSPAIIAENILMRLYHVDVQGHLF